MDFEEARVANDEKHLGRIAQIRRGEDIDTLGPFAKAYLGMFLNFEIGVSPQARISLLANEKLANAVLDGFDAVLNRGDFPAPAEIAAALMRGDFPLIGYTVRAGMDRLAEHSPEDVMSLPAATLQSAVCFHYANASSHPDKWFGQLVAARPDLASNALRDFWVGMIKAGADSLPGLHHFLGKEQHIPVMREVVIPLLRNWRDCRVSDLRDLLYAALRYADHEALLATARDMLADERVTGIKRQNYWMITAFLLSPDEYAQPLAQYAGWSKEKILPLLDFVIAVLSPDIGHEIKLSPMGYSSLLRVIGPTFPPLGISGRLDDISQKVVWLFEQMVSDGGDEAAEAVRRLRRVRVMKVCTHVLDHAEALLNGSQKSP